jgi:2'-5' RNA ligase
MRVFVAIDVGDAVRAEVTRVVAAVSARLEAAKTPPKVTWVKPAALHVTLKFLGETSDEEVARVRDLLAPPIPVPPFEIEWRGIGAFPSPRHPRALWMGVIRGASQLGAVEAEVSRRLGQAGADESRPFLPHLTLGRIKMTGQGVDWPKVLQAVDVRGVTSRADRITLYRSELSQRGPHYTGLISAPLRITNNQ